MKAKVTQSETDALSQQVLGDIKNIIADYPARPLTKKALLLDILIPIQDAQANFLLNALLENEEKRYIKAALNAHQIGHFLIGTLVRLALDGNTQWDDDELFIGQFMHSLHDIQHHTRVIEPDKPRKKRRKK